MKTAYYIDKNGEYQYDIEGKKKEFGSYKEAIEALADIIYVEYDIDITRQKYEYEDYSSLVEDNGYSIDMEEVDDKGERTNIRFERYETALYVAEFLIDNVN
jgi:hypothetical protein